jgi:hypothetical protein
MLKINDKTEKFHPPNTVLHNVKLILSVRK